MIAKLLYDKWKKLVNRANKYGVPLPTVRDPKTGIGSISLTLLTISASLVVIGIVGKWSKIAGAIDMNNAMEFFYTACALYFGRQWQVRSTETKVGAEIQEGSDPKNSDQPQ